MFLTPGEEKQKQSYLDRLKQTGSVAKHAYETYTGKQASDVLDSATDAALHKWKKLPPKLQRAAELTATHVRQRINAQK